MLDQQQQVTPEVETHPLIVRIRPVIDMTDDQFFEQIRQFIPRPTR